ncbi:response regulator transcription factor [Desulfotomaculum copahuensis]|uniref:Stage 0 sporulation protein A homolog n=1 Tax=Desulfotomaculum copahuensis TaxID=1838280 RepID=A0A1B7LEX2_9FIRM|nr:response regulator transcription factor [Desulfotomaculum copahuensis]OAT81845.1 DNA-binding response regulator [Desulfotomaculum copahuensis]
MPNILVVDDEQKIRELIRIYLEPEGFQVTEAENGRQALDILSRENFDLVILDLMMPDVDGWAVCREVRKNSSVPIIMLTARGDEIDRVLGLELGADDYMVKPFSPREMVARVKAVLRRTLPEEPKKGRLQFDGLSIDPSSRQVTVLGRPVSLTPKEYDLLYFLAQSPGRVYTREQLLENVWGYDFFGEVRTVDTHVTRLREKLARVKGAPQYVSTVWGVGYKFEVSK